MRTFFTVLCERMVIIMDKRTDANNSKDKAKYIIENEKKLTFEKAMSNLEMIVKRLENGEVTLDESLKMFDEGVKLVKLCNSLLDKAEQKVILLMKSSDSIVEKPFISE